MGQENHSKLRFSCNTLSSLRSCAHGSCHREGVVAGIINLDGAGSSHDDRGGMLEKLFLEGMVGEKAVVVETLELTFGAA